MEDNNVAAGHETAANLTAAQMEAVANADAHTNNAGLPTYTELCASLKQAQKALAEKTAEQEKQIGALLDQINRNVVLEYGWHENPDNHTLRMTLFFGDFDPRPYVAYTSRGLGKLTRTLLDQLLRAG